MQEDSPGRPAFDHCVLTSAQAEQEWIARHVAQGIGRPQHAFIDYAIPTVIHGRSTNAAPDEVERAQAAGAAILQRRTGGGVVLAGPWMLGSALLLPPGHPFGKEGIVSAFRQSGAVWASALRDVGVACEAATPEAMARHNDVAQRAGVRWVCFSGLSHGELTDAQGCKLLGLAQSRGRWGTLVSAGLLLRPVPWQLLGWVHLAEAQWEPGIPSSAGAAVAPVRLRAALLASL